MPNPHKYFSAYLYRQKTLNAVSTDVVNHTLPQKVLHSIEDHHLLETGTPVLVGFSGGIDSVVLVHVLQTAGFPVTSAHINYRLRGTESDADESFVREFCARSNIPLHVASYDTPTYAAERGLSIQEAAREIRYSFFERLAIESNLLHVAVGHHRDDQIETVLLNVFRGTGPEGLAGMRIIRPISPFSPVKVIRPLLEIRRVEIEAYARLQHLSWRTDKSNQNGKYRRTAIRYEIIPSIEKYFGTAATENIARSSEHVRQFLTHLVEPERERLWSRCAVPQPGGGALDVSCLLDLPGILRRSLILEGLERWIPDLTRTESSVRVIEELLYVQTGRRAEFKAGTVWRDRNDLFFSRKKPETPDLELPQQVNPGSTLEIPGGLLQIRVQEEKPESLEEGAPLTLYMDADRLHFPLIVDRWKPGDRFQPLGMNQRKKISDFLTDSRVPPQHREGILVLRSRDSIIAVLGHRIAEDFRIRPSTERFAKITYIPVPTV